MKFTKRAIVQAAGVSLTLGLASLSAWAAPPVAVPYTFTSGTPAKAAEVNADFKALATAIDGTNTAVSSITSSPQTFSQSVTINGNLTVGGESDLRVQGLAADPAAASAGNRGQIYLDTSSGVLKISDGTVWRASNARNYVHTDIATTDTSEPLPFCYTGLLMLSQRTVSITTTAASEVRYSYTDSVASTGTSLMTVILYMDGVRINSQIVQGTGAYFAAVAISGYRAATPGTHTFTVGVMQASASCPAQFTMGYGTFFSLEAEQMSN